MVCVFIDCASYFYYYYLCFKKYRMKYIQVSYKKYMVGTYLSLSLSLSLSSLVL